MLPLYTVLPFVAMLLAIAVCPLGAPHGWEANRNKMLVSCLLGLPILGLYVMREPKALLGMAEEYVSFIILLAGLYVISGGILMRGDLTATPLTNTGFLALGAALASFIGTTGASMLVIRPVLPANRERARAVLVWASPLGLPCLFGAGVPVPPSFVWHPPTTTGEPIAAIRRDRA